jgi:signal transduction histidine kinase/ActR/RegA family two-component response regulator
MTSALESPIAVCLALSRAICRSQSLDDIYAAALDALGHGLGVSRSSILLFDADEVMRFEAHRGLSDAYRRAVEGHTPWTPHSVSPEPIIVGDAAREDSLRHLLPVIAAEGIAAMAFIPLVSLGRVIGKFMVYYDAPTVLGGDQLQLAEVIAAEVAFAIQRTRAEAAAEEANRLKDEFLATLSHELRTPLNAILGWSHVLLTDSLPPERAKHALEIVNRNAALQAQLIEDILDISRIIKGKLEIERRPMNVGLALTTVLEGVMPAAAAKQIQLTHEIPGRLPPIEGDAKRLQQVFGNIVSNAIKFTPQGGRISAQCSVDGDSITIDVRDSGVGIEPALLPFIFDRFRQGDSRSTRKHGGLGLGLAIANHLLEQHGGDMRAHSDGPGRGTRFEVRLPLALTMNSQAEVGSPVPEELILDGATVLVVDDLEDSRELLATIFGQWGAEVVQCESVDAAFQALESTPIHLLVADIAMPDIDGYELIARVRGLEDRRATVPAIVVSAYARTRDRHRALAQGYDGYCAKPVDRHELAEVVSEVLRPSRGAARHSA